VLKDGFVNIIKNTLTHRQMNVKGTVIWVQKWLLKIMFALSDYRYLSQYIDVCRRTGWTNRHATACRGRGSDFITHVRLAPGKRAQMWRWPLICMWPDRLGMCFTSHLLLGTSGSCKQWKDTQIKKNASYVLVKRESNTYYWITRELQLGEWNFCIKNGYVWTWDN
jgi:hypothetical protein